jgi:hypothetical protein
VVAFIASGLIFLFSDIVQYGLTFQGPYGSCIPVGIVFVLLAGIIPPWKSLPCRQRTSRLINRSGSFPLLCPE